MLRSWPTGCQAPGEGPARTLHEQTGSLVHVRHYTFIHHDTPLGQDAWEVAPKVLQELASCETLDARFSCSELMNIERNPSKQSL